MKQGHTLKIRTQITLFAVAILLSILLFTVFFFTAFSRLIDQQNQQHFEDMHTSAAQEIMNTLFSIQQQLMGLDSSKSLQSYYFADNPWDAYIYGTSIRNSLLEATALIDSLKVIAIDFRYQNAVISGSSLKLSSYASMLEQAMRLEREGSRFPVCITGYGGRSYLVFCQPLSVYSLSYKQMQHVANAYAIVQADVLLPDVTPQHNHLIVSTQSGAPEVIAASDNQLVDRLLSSADFPLDQSAVQSVSLDYVNYLCGISVLDEGLSYITIQTTASLEENSRSILIIAYLFLLLLFLFCGYGIFYINRRISIPMRRIENGLIHIGGGDISYRLDRMNQDEFGQIASSVNHLLDEIENQIQVNDQTRQKLHELELLQKNSELLALRYQINPHFLYNTLECVRSIAACYQADAVDQIVTELIGIFRYCTAGSNYSTVAEELACCRHYSEIIRIRFDGKYEFRFEVSPEILHCSIPKMTLQPIVENAVYHGLEGQRFSGTVTVRGYVAQQSIVLQVHDTGAGIPADRLHKLRLKIYSADASGTDGHGIGLANVHQRLANEYGAPFGLTIDSEEGRYTVITLRIPRI